MTDFVPSGTEQRAVVETEAPLAVVMGGAGTGKTTCALAAARAHLERPTTRTSDRALFLSFSRASVSRIVGRGRGVLGSATERVDISTFHALAFGIVRRFGSLVGHPRATLTSPAEHRINPGSGALGYDDLIPLAIQIIDVSPAARHHLQSTWGLVVVDEYQDTGDLQAALLRRIAANARVILLGDPNQCIYTFLKSDGVRLERIQEACARAGAENTIQLPEASHRDPTGVIPAAASAIMRREFSSEAISTAVSTGRLVVRSGIEQSEEAEVVARCVTQLHDEGLSVAVFSHHNDMLAALSDGLNQEGIDHEVAGLSDALAAALIAQVAMLIFSVGEARWEEVLNSLAVFVASAVRGNRTPELARHIIDGSGAVTLQARLVALRDGMADAGLDDALRLAADAHGMIGLPNKSSAWAHAAGFLRPIRAQASRALGRRASDQAVARAVSTAAREATYGVLTEVAEDPREIQLMNLYQTKGREADATVIVLRQGDFFGYETAPFPETSRLMYVVFSRARQKVIVLLVGSGLPPVVAPLARLAS